MMRKTFSHFVGSLLAAPILYGLMSVPAARAAVTEDQARRSVEQQFGVRVLKVEKTQLHDKPVYILTVMSPGGASNSAFQVNWLAIDPETGKLVSGFRHLPSGASDAAGSGSYEPNRQPDGVLSQGRVWR